jgi:sulfatase maturation enzyme AslB (radical SAM superfamily)
MPNSKIFCNVPWTNFHIYWDGSFGACCSESGKAYPAEQSNNYNLSKATITDWFHGPVMTKLRQDILQDQPLALCRNCYYEENVGYESRRIKENFKSVIFTEQAFDRSFQQSPMRDKFTPTVTSLPIDWHVDLGNECNLACKMCWPKASSKISNYYVKWGLITDSANRNWTKDQVSWDNFLTSIDSVPNLNRIHFMGGEPVLNKRFGELLDYLLNNGRQNLSISFVSNGTIFDEGIIKQLQEFRSADIEISLESIHDNNHYIRQGSSTQQVLANVERLIAMQTDTFHVIMRSVPQLLNVNNYDQYLQWVWGHQVSIQGIPLTNPKYLRISVLPHEIKQKLLPQYQKLREQFYQENTITRKITTGRGAGGLAQQLLRECDSIIHVLTEPEPPNVEALRHELVDWLLRWDREFNLNALEVYPEYNDFLKQYGYHVQ